MEWLIIGTSFFCLEIFLFEIAVNYVNYEWRQEKKEVPPLLFHFRIIQNDKTITYFVVKKKKNVNSNVGSWKTGTFYVTDRQTHLRLLTTLTNPRILMLSFLEASKTFWNRLKLSSMEQLIFFWENPSEALPNTATSFTPHATFKKK